MLDMTDTCFIASTTVAVVIGASKCLSARGRGAVPGGRSAGDPEVFEIADRPGISDLRDARGGA